MNNDETFISFNGCTKDRWTIKANKGFIIVHLSLVHPLKLIKASIMKPLLALMGVLKIDE
jgi:hypothetical protein